MSNINYSIGLNSIGSHLGLC